MRLYEISTEYQKLFDQLDACETDEERAQVQAQIDHLDVQAEDKILAVAGHVRNIETQAEAIRAAVKEMEKRARRYEKIAEDWKNYIRFHADSMTIQFPVINAYLQVTKRKGQAKLNITDKEKLVFDYGKIVLTEDVVIDNEAVKNDLLNGVIVEGANLTYTTSIIIK